MLRRATSGLALADLWANALGHLREDDQQQFGFAQTDKRAALESLLQTINSQKEDTVKAELVIRRSHGKLITLRDVFAKIVNCISKFKEVGDTITQFDPVHAALPWAAVRFILQAAMSEQQIYQGMIDGLERVADVIARYAWIETLYLHASSRMRTQLQDAITKLYVAVLIFLAKARRYYSKHTFQRVLKSLVQIDEQAVKRYLKAITDEEEKVNRIAHLIDAQYLREISKSMEGGFSSLLSRVGGVSQQISNVQIDVSKQTPLNDIQRDELLRWVDGVSTYENFHTAKNARHRGTCDWILRNEAYLSWLDTKTSSTARILWLHGKHGTGKTILSARITEHLSEKQSKCFAYFFCFYGTELQRQCNGIVKAWISQIVKGDDDAFDAAVNIYKEREGTFANFVELWQIFRRINALPRTHYFLVDGFDECGKQDSTLPQHSLHDAKTTFLTQLSEAISGTGARVIIISRPDPEVKLQLQLSSQDTASAGVVWNDYEITLEDTSEDLKSFAENVMNLKIPNRDEDLRQELAAGAAEKADGMFLWIKLLYSQLSRSRSTSRLRKIITDTPSGLDQAYQRDLMNILDLDAEERGRAVAILRWTLFAFQPLTIRQLSEALLVEFRDEDKSDDEDRVIREYSNNSQDCSSESDTSDESNNEKTGSYLNLADVPDFGDDDTVAHELLKGCGALLELRDGETSAPEDMTIHFVHFSVQEYLLRSLDVNIPGFQELRLSDRHFGHEKLALICLQYLLYDDFRQENNSSLDQFHKREEKYALLDYTGRHWGWHANCCRPLPGSIISLCNELLDPLNKKWLSYSEVVGGRANGSYRTFINRFRDSYPSPLFYASLWGIVETMQFLMSERKAEVNHVGGLYGSPLKAAAAHDHADAVNLLLENGADINLNSGQFGTAIQTAAARGQVKIVAILLQHKPDVNMRGGWRDETPLLASSKIGSRKTAEEVVEQLITAGADIEATDNKGITAMHNFAQNGATNVLKLLVNYNANVNCQDLEGTTPLMLAVEEKRQSTVNFLIRSGADVNIKNYEGATALHLCYGHVACMSTLLEHGADPHAKDIKGRTPLDLMEKAEYSDSESIFGPESDEDSGRDEQADAQPRGR